MGRGRRSAWGEAVRAQSGQRRDVDTAEGCTYLHVDPGVSCRLTSGRECRCGGAPWGGGAPRGGGWRSGSVFGLPLEVSAILDYTRSGWSLHSTILLIVYGYGSLLST
eukprot:1807760-Prymnesium_polylepis.2